MLQMDMERIYALMNSAIQPRRAIGDGRAWLLDCFPEPEDQEEIALLNAVRIVQSVETHYEGGYMQFLRDGFNLKTPA